MKFLTSVASLLLCVLEVIHSQQHGDLRLAQQEVINFSFTSGRLEIYINSTWGSICADKFEMHDADVACKQLGFSRALQVATSFHTPYGRGRVGPVWLDEVECKDDDLLHILSCSHVRHEDIDCDHFSDVAIECSNDPSEEPVEDLSVRLVSREFMSQGMLEVHCNNSWSPVCPSQGTVLRKSEGDAICRQLGYTESVRYALRDNDYEGSDVSPVSFQDFECNKDGQDLISCGATCSMIGVVGNGGTSFVRGPGCIYLECTHAVPYGSLRLSNDTTVTPGALSGRLEIFKDGTWGSVCHHGFNDQAANISCRQLGFAGALSFGFSKEEYGEGDENFPLFGGANCSPYDSKLVSCMNLAAEANCTHSEDVAIFCSMYNSSKDDHPPADPEKQSKELPLEVFIAIIVGPCLVLILCCACTAIYSIHFKLVPYDTMKKPASHGLYFTEYEGSNLTLNEMNLEKILESPASKKLQRCNEKNIKESALDLDLDSKPDPKTKYTPVLSPIDDIRYTTCPAQHQAPSPVNIATSPVPQPSILGRQPSNTYQPAGVTSPRLHRKFIIPSVPREPPPPSPILSGPVPPPLVVKRNLIIRRSQDQLHSAMDMTPSLTSPISPAESKKGIPATSSSIARSFDPSSQSNVHGKANKCGSNGLYTDVSIDGGQPVQMKPAPQKGIRKLSKTLSQISEINLEAVAINNVSDSYKEMNESSSSTANSKGSNTHKVSFKLE